MGRIIPYMMENKSPVPNDQPVIIGYHPNISPLVPLLPSGEHTKNYGKSPCYQWVNPLFLWPFSMSQNVCYGKITMLSIHYFYHHAINGKITIFNVANSYKLPEGISLNFTTSH